MGVTVLVRVWVADCVKVGVGVGVDALVEVTVWVAVRVGVNVGVLVEVTVLVGVGVGVLVAVTVWVAVGVEVKVGVGVGLGQIGSPVVSQRTFLEVTVPARPLKYGIILEQISPETKGAGPGIAIELKTFALQSQ